MLKEAAISGADAEGGGQAINELEGRAASLNRIEIQEVIGCVELNDIAWERRSILNIDQVQGGGTSPR